MLRKKQHRIWLAQHHGKVSFATPRQALKVAMIMRLRHRRLMPRLRPYRCTWTGLPDPRKGGPPHWHLGNRKRHPFAKLRRFILKHTLWRYYRVRRAWRVSRGAAQYPPPPRTKRAG